MGLNFNLSQTVRSQLHEIFGPMSRLSLTLEGSFWCVDWNEAARATFSSQSQVSSQKNSLKFLLCQQSQQIKDILIQHGDARSPWHLFRSS